MGQISSASVLTFLDTNACTMSLRLLERKRRQQCLTEHRQTSSTEHITLCVRLQLPTCDRVFCQTYSLEMGSPSCLPRFYDFPMVGNLQSLPWPSNHSFHETIDVDL
ncbi:hypothetical protein PV04_00919 [Phialophora macrospora]|uniref:Uncharacterized protein n=1 Tax=Phialophora macrospora TaxID=1851006 RepID=A0A0D2GK23_9EURO|nr:hypothetical protein PV04_00919 [Phialophora macrospora]